MEVGPALEVGGQDQRPLKAPTFVAPALPTLRFIFSDDLCLKIIVEFARITIKIKS